MKNIIVVEGPAGSGKSTFIYTLINQINELSGQPLGEAVCVSHSLPRKAGELSPTEYVVHSLFNDTTKAIQALTSPAPTVFIDRLGLSQQVYGKLRNGVLELPYTIEKMSIVEELMLFTRNQLYRRSGVYVDYNLTVVVLLPPEKTIELWRTYCDREFPWSPADELSLYRQFTDGSQAIRLDPSENNDWLTLLFQRELA